VVAFFREKFIEATEKDEDETFVSDFVYSLLKKFELKKELTEWNGYIIFNTVFGINVAKEVKGYAKYLVALFVRAHRSKFIMYESLLCLEYKLCKQYPDQDFTKYISTIMMNFYQCDI